MKKKKHILIISQYFYPETFRINDMALEWQKRGYRVTVLTGIPNYPKGKYFDGYSLFKKRKENWHGINIIRIPLIARGKKSIGMVLNYFSFVISGWFWKSFTKLKVDYVFSFEVSPMTQVKIGCWYARKHKIPHYAYIQDLWPENIEAITGIHNKLIINPIDKMVDKIYKQVDEIFATSPSFVDAIINREVPVDSKKVHYWPQYAEEFYKPMKKEYNSYINDDGSFKIAFTGSIGYAQGLDILPKTAEILKKENIKFVIVGDGRYMDEFIKEIENRKIQEKFIIIPRQPAETIPKILSVCDVSFVSFMNIELFEKTIPAKLQSYMACGMPIIAVAKGETKRIIEEANCGVCSEFGDENMLAEKIKKIMNMDLTTMRNNSIKYFKKNFSKKKLMDEIDKYF